MEICRRKKHRTKDGGGEAVASEKHENCGKMWIAKKNKFVQVSIGAAAGLGRCEFHFSYSESAIFKH